MIPLLADPLEHTVNEKFNKIPKSIDFAQIFMPNGNVSMGKSPKIILKIETKVNVISIWLRCI